MANRFLNNIRINDEYTLPAADGSADQIITTDGSGQLSFVDQSTINAGNAEHVVIYAKNTHTAQITKGTPVYITGTVGATDTVAIAPADASNSAKMPAVGILDDTLAVNAFGYVITGGFMDNITTSPIDGATPSSNDTVYVKAGGGLTLTKPTGASNLIQNIAKVGKVSGGNSGSLIVSSILRTNDVPNLTTGKIWVGTATNTAESGVVHLDEGNGRMGINANSPLRDLHVVGNFAVNAGTNQYYGVYIPGSGEGSDPNIIIGDWHNASATLKWDSSARSLNIDTQYSTGAGTFNITGNDGASTFLTINSSGNVGIGTTNPGEKLTVVGNLLLNNSGEGWIKGYDNYHSIKFRAGGTNKTEYYEYGGTLAAGLGHKFFTGGTTSQTLKFQVADDGAYFSGNVGIGTTAPSYKLHVDDNTAYGGVLIEGDNAPGLSIRDNSGSSLSKIYVQSTAASQGNLRISSDDNNTATTPTIEFLIGNSHKMRILDNGNVGIGTTNPGRNLQVQGTGNTALAITSPNTNYVQLALGDTDDDNYGQIILDNSTNKLQIQNGGGSVISDRGITLDSSENVGIGTASPTGKFNSYISAARQLTHNGNGGDLSIISDNNSSPVFYVKGTGTADLVNVYDNTNEVFTIKDGGNVGIGTTSPGAKLEIEGSDNHLLQLNTASSTGNPYISFNQAGTRRSFIQHHDSNDYLKLASEYGGILLLTGTGGTETEKVRIEPGGNVGIGTTSPSAKLEVSDSNTTKTAIHIDNTSTGGHRWDIASIGSAVSGRVGNLQIRNDSDTLNIVEITGAGNVGIGTTSPSATLELNSSTANAAKLRVGRLIGLSNYLELGTSGGESVINSIGTASVNGSIIFNRSTTTATSESMRIDSSGNVGIGTTNPIAKLQVVGTSTYNSDTVKAFRVSDSTTITKAVDIGYDAALDAGFIQAGYFGVAYKHLLLQPNDNNVGIGTVSPGQKLSVAGNIALVSNNSFISFNTSASSGDPKIQMGSDGDFSFLNTAGSTNLHIENGGNVGIGTTSPGAKLEVRDSSTQPGLLITSDGGNEQFKIQRYSNNNEQLILGFHSSDYAQIQAVEQGVSYRTLALNPNGGNVGIGETNPGAKLHVKQTVDREGIKISSSAVQPELTLIDDATGDYFGIGHNRSASLLQFEHNNTNVMYLSHDGNLGIGTDSFTEKLTVNGNISLENSGTPIFTLKDTGNAGGGGASGMIRFKNTAGDAIGIGYTSNDTTTSDLLISTNAASTYGGYLGLDANAITDPSSIILDPKTNVIINGNVGIGTTSPDAPLTVHNSTDPEIRFGYSSTQDHKIQWDSSKVYIYADPENTNGSSALALGVDGSLGFYMDSSRNVGIGTTNPDSKLHIVNPDGGSYRFGYGGSSDVYFDSDTVYFRTDNGGANLMTSNVNGLGIGTTSPTQKLHVVGNARVTGAYYDSNNSAGTSGQVLSSTATGTDWITLNDTYYTETEADNRFVNVTGDTMTGDLTMGGNFVYDAVIGFNNMGATQGPSPNYNYRYFRITNDLTFDRNRIYELLIDADDNGGYSSIYHIYISQHNNSGNHDRVRFHYISGDKDRAELLVATDEHVWVRATAKWGNVKIRAIHENEDVSSMPFATTETRPTTQANGTSDFVWNGDNNTFTDQEQWHAGNDGSGSGLDADTVDGLQAFQFLRSDAADTAAGLITFTSGATFGSGVTLTESTDRADLLYINSSTSSYGGLQIGNTSNEFIFSLMGNGNLGGIYDDLNSDWIMQWDENGESRLYYNGGERLNTSSAGVTITGDLTVSGGDITLSGTGRIQGIDTVSAGTDAANKTYVDNAVSGLVTSVSGGDGIVLTGTSAAPIVNIDYTGTDNAILSAVDGSGSTIASGAKIWFSDDATIAHANVSDLPFASSSHNHDSDYVNVTGDTMTGNLVIGTGSADNYVRSYHSDGNYTEMRGYGLQFSRAASYIRPTADNTKNLYIGTTSQQWNSLAMDASTTTFNVNGSEKMRINSSGNVCIATTSEFTTGGTAKLTIASNSAISWGASNTDMSYFRRIAAGEFQWQTYNSGNTGEIHLQPYGGNVGIGTTSPWTLLTLGADPKSGTANAGVALAFEGTNFAEYGYRFKANGANYYQVLYDGSAINWKNYAGGASYTTRMSLTNAGNLIIESGNVGIGTTSPDYKLDVAGTIGMDTYLYHNGDTDTFIGYSEANTFDVNAGGVKQLSVTSDNVNITDTLSYTYPSGDGQYNGEIVTFGSFNTANGTIAEGDVIVYTTAGLQTGWMRAQGNTTYSKGMLGIAMGTSASDGILIKGFARNTAFASGGLGSPLYLSPTSAGDTTNTIPSSTNNIVRIVGYMLNPTNDEIFFDPDKSWVQVSS